MTPTRLSITLREFFLEASPSTGNLPARGQEPALGCIEMNRIDSLNLDPRSIDGTIWRENASPYSRQWLWKDGALTWASAISPLVPFQIAAEVKNHSPPKHFVVHGLSSSPLVANNAAFREQQAPLWFNSERQQDLSVICKASKTIKLRPAAHAANSRFGLLTIQAASGKRLSPRKSAQK